MNNEKLKGETSKEADKKESECRKVCKDMETIDPPYRSSFPTSHEGRVFIKLCSLRTPGSRAVFLFEML